MSDRLLALSTEVVGVAEMSADVHRIRVQTDGPVGDLKNFLVVTAEDCQAVRGGGKRDPVLRLGLHRATGQFAGLPATGLVILEPTIKRLSCDAFAQGR